MKIKICFLSAAIATALVQTQSAVAAEKGNTAAPAPSLAPTGSGDRDWEAVEAMRKAQPPDTREKMGAKDHALWWDNHAKELAQAAVKFAETHPHDPRRWSALVQVGYVAPTFIKGFSPGYEEKPSRALLVVDEEAVAEFKARQTHWLRQLLDSTDAEEGVRIGASGWLIIESKIKAQKEPSAENRAELRKLTHAFIARFPKSPSVKAAAETYLEVLRAQVPAEATAYEEELKASPLAALQEVGGDFKAKIAAFADIGALAFTAVDGRPVNLAQLKGKVVLIDFWATWCGPCVAELPNVKSVYQRYHEQGFEVVGISLDNATDRKKLTDFTAKNEMPWPQYFDGKGWKGDLVLKYGVKLIPAMVLLDKTGKPAAFEARGPRLETEVKRLLAQ